MAGFLFYWIAWSGWIFATFIMNKQNRHRFIISLTLLVTIILSVHPIMIFNLEISLASCFLLFFGLLSFIKYRVMHLLYMFIRLIIVSFAGAIFLLLALYDPVWLFIEAIWLQAIIFTFLGVILFKNFRERVIALVIGFVMAEFIYAIVLKKFNIYYSIGSLEFWDGLAFTCLISTVWYGFEYLQISFQKNNQLEKEKTLYHE